MEAKQVKDLMEAYASVYTQPEQEVLSEDLQGKVKAGLEKGAEFMKTNPVGKAISGALSPVGSGRKTPTKKSGGYRPVANEGTDLFDCILEYLVAEGYANTNESAIIIMANMSEEWRHSIVEQLDPDSPGNTHSLGDLYKAQEKWKKEQEEKKKKPSGSGQVKGA